MTAATLVSPSSAIPSPSLAPSTKGERVKALTGKARIDALTDFIGCFEGPEDLSERHSDYFAEALNADFERKRKLSA